MAEYMDVVYISEDWAAVTHTDYLVFFMESHLLFVLPLSQLVEVSFAV